MHFVLQHFFIIVDHIIGIENSKEENSINQEVKNTLISLKLCSFHFVYKNSINAIEFVCHGNEKNVKQI